MSKLSAFYDDGLFRPDVETTVIPRLKYPFAMNPTPDIYAKIEERDYNVLPTLYTPRIANRTAFTNLLTYSEDFSNAAWTKSDATIAAGQAANPSDGLVTMSALLETATTAAHLVYETYSAVNGTTYTISFIAKKLGRDFILIAIADGTASASAFFNLNSGTVGTDGAAGIVPLGNGCYRCSITFTASHTATGTVSVRTSIDGATTSYAGDITKGAYIWGADLKAGTTPGPYIATANVARTISAPDQDVTINPNTGQPDPFAYLVAEGDPNNITSTVAALVRSFARVPGQQTIFSTLTLTKPSPSALGALLDNIVGDLTVGVYGPLYSFNNYWCLTSSNKIFGAAAATTSSNSGADTRVVFGAAHGIAGTEQLVIHQASNYTLLNPANYSVINSTTIDILAVNFGNQVTDVAKYYRSYTPGLDRVGCKVISNFYLPGVTVGITTAADIPVPATLLNDAEFLNAVLANLTGYVTYDAKELTNWLDGPIYRQDTIQINMADA